MSYIHQSGVYDFGCKGYRPFLTWLASLMITSKSTALGNPWVPIENFMLMYDTRLYFTWTVMYPGPHLPSQG